MSGQCVEDNPQFLFYYFDKSGHGGVNGNLGDYLSPQLLKAPCGHVGDNIFLRWILSSLFQLINGF